MNANKIEGAEVALVNEYGSCFGMHLTFNTYAEMRKYELEFYGDEGFPQSSDIFDQVRVTVLEWDGGLYDKIRSMGLV